MVSMAANSDAAYVVVAAKTAGSSATSAASSPMALTASGKPKEKRRNNEKRKEKSRDAARCRRSRETEIFSDLAQVLPLEREDVNQLDKASVMRIAIAYLKVREMLQLFPKIQDLIGDLKIDTDDDPNSALPAMIDETSKDAEAFDLLRCAEASQLMKQTLDGFLIVLSNDGDITYVSDNITEYLGIAKIDILGQTIWEYSHQCDHAELKEALNIKRNGLADKVKDEHLLEQGLSTDHRELFVRFKCTLTSRGRSINIKSASYKVIHITGHLVVNTKGDRVLVAIGRPIPHPSNIEIPLGTTTFLTKHTLDMKFTYVDDKMSNLLGYKPEDLIEESLYDCHHGADSDSLMATFKIVLSKGQGETCRYRFLGKYGGYCWIVTQATIVYDKLKPQSVVCVNYVISNLENNDEIYSLAQYEASEQQKLEEENNNNNNNNNTSNDHFKQKTLELTVKPHKQEPIEIEKDCSNSKGTSNVNHNASKVELFCNTSSRPPPPTAQQQVPKLSTSTLQSSAHIDGQDDDDDVDLDDEQDDSLCFVIKREQHSPPAAAAAAPAPPVPPTATTKAAAIIVATPISLNNNNGKLIDNKPQIRDQSSLSPLRRSLQSNCLISNKAPKLIEENRPKSVTASVFRAAPTANSNDLLPININSAGNSNHSNHNNSGAVINTTTNNYNNNNSSNSLSAPPLYLNTLSQVSAFSAPRAQSVTASVFTPISQLTNKEQEQIVKATTSTTAAIRSQQHQLQQQQQNQQDMNKVLASFADIATELTMLKEEPDDLVHLPSASVDACLPLDETTPLFGEMLGLMGSYGGLLADDINSLDSTTSSCTAETCTKATAATTAAHICNNGNNNYSNSNNNNKSSDTTTGNGSNKTGHNIDPFINYREESNDTNCSQHLLSPSVTSKSPEASSLPSLCSPNSLCQEDEFAFMTMSVDDDIDMTMRAPYIPMNEQEDLPLLTADDLMWCSSDAFTADDLNMQKDADAIEHLQHLQQQQQEACGDNNRNLLSYQQQQQQQLPLQQQNFSNSLCSSPASTVSSLSPSPVTQHQQSQQQQQQQESSTVFSSDSSELAALLCGAGSGTLSILGNNCGGGNVSDDNDGSSGIGSIGDAAALSPVQQHHQQQQQQQQQQSPCMPLTRLLQLKQHLDEKEQRQHQQQQQQHLLGLNIDCKKQKYNNSVASSICDAFFYSKDIATNFDCLNELLQINVGDSSSVAASPTGQQQLEDLQQQQQQQDRKQHLQQLQQQQQQNIIMNAVPLITIQSNKNLLLQQQQQQQRIVANNNNNSNNKMIINEQQLPAPTCGSKVASIKLLNGGATATPLAATAAAIRVADSKVQQRGVQTAAPSLQQQPPHFGNKRHLSNAAAATQLESKRLKSAAAATVELQTTPELLQQLMAPLQQVKEQQQQSQQQKQQQQRKAAAAAATQRWANSAEMKSALRGGNALQQQQQQSNSVLKNLLISGCDDVITTKQEPMQMDDGDSMDQSPMPLCISPTLAKPLHCVTTTATASVLRNYRHNPMIGGPGVLPSPPFASSDDSNPPGLTSCDSDSANDSGIEENGVNETNSPLKRLGAEKKVETKKPLVTARSAPAPTQQRKQTAAGVTTSAPEAAGGSSGTSSSCSSRKTSISLMDNSNPLHTPIFMDLCNDDYNMTTEQLLSENDIEHVLSEWTNDMV